MRPPPKLPLKLCWAASTGLAIVMVAAVALVTRTALVSGANAADKDPQTSQSSKNAGFARYWQPAEMPEREAYREEPMPPGFQVVIAPLEGPVFADHDGRTLYTWPLRSLRNGATGDRETKASACTDEVLKVTAGLMSPYPAGLVLPDLDTRPSCVALWPPVLAPKDAIPKDALPKDAKIGKWTVIKREDGADQWAYDGYPVYTSVLDRQVGDVRGATKLNAAGDGGVARKAIGPAPAIPAEFDIVESSSGRLLVNKQRYSVYVWDGDGNNISNCNDDCLKEWSPVLAPEIANARDGWTVIKRAPGVSQWAFRGQPLYTYNNDRGLRSFWGADVAGWHNVYTQRTLPPPEGFTVQDVEAGGEVLADSRGRTIYQYNCRDDSFAQLACDNPDSTQAYRLAICGNGDAKLCRETFPYVIAPAGAKDVGRLWTVMAIDPDTGHRAAPGQKALNVWAYRDRPVYTFSGDDQPGVTNGDGYGEFTGKRNGFKAFVFRDIFQGNAFRP